LTLTTKAELESLVARQTEALKSQLDRIAELEAEVARLNAVISGGHDALQTLQRLYSDTSQPVSVIMRAAAEAAPYERAKAPQVSHIGLFVDDFAARLRAQRMGLVDVTPDDEADEA
jgi:hypothetical protein